MIFCHNSYDCFENYKKLSKKQKNLQFYKLQVLIALFEVQM